MRLLQADGRNHGLGCQHPLEDLFCDDLDPSDQSATSLHLLRSSSDEFTSLLACDEELACEEDCATTTHWGPQPQHQEWQSLPKLPAATTCAPQQQLGVGQHRQAEEHHPCSQHGCAAAAAAATSSPCDRRHPETQLPTGHCLITRTRNEHMRQQEVSPDPGHLDRHAISEQHRGVAISWLMEVAHECRMHAATLFQAVSFLDRFLSVTKDVTPGMLQLVATAALSIAAKFEEYMQPTPEEWTSIAGDSFQKDDLLKTEYLYLSFLKWRLRTPTAYTFLQLMTSALQLGLKETELAHQFLELSLLEYGVLQHSYATVAAAAIAAAHHRCGTTLDQQALYSLAPFLNEGEVQSCAALLLCLQAQCSAPALAPGLEHWAFLRRRHGCSA